MEGLEKLLGVIPTESFPPFYSLEAGSKRLETTDILYCMCRSIATRMARTKAKIYDCGARAWMNNMREFNG
jgi:hypothetical protein